MLLSSLIETLGGVAAVARACGVTTQAVSNWKAAGAAPAHHHVRLWVMATRAGHPWAPPGADGMRLVLPAEAAPAPMAPTPMESAA